MNDRHFIPFASAIDPSLIPDQMNDPFAVDIPDIAKIAAAELQYFLQKNQYQWQHNFGLEPGKAGPEKGKMFGVLVVENADKGLGYLCTFSGKFADEPHPEIFVPSLFNIATNDYFINRGMTELTRLGIQIDELKARKDPIHHTAMWELKEERKLKSTQLQNELFDQYHFLNQVAVSKSIWDIFMEYDKRKPASGAGECAAPKLLQYAFERKMKPLAMAEFWWGKASKSEDRKHGCFYPACEDKCRPILGHMLSW